MGTVFDKRNPLPLGEIAESVQIRGMATHVNSNDGLCTRRDGRFREFGIETPGVRRDVHGDRQRAGVENGAGRSDEGVVGEDHFISGADAEGGYGDFESGRTVGHGNAVFGAVKFGECLFKGESSGSGSSPPNATVENILKSFAFRVVILRPNRKAFLVRLLTAIHCEFRHGNLLSWYEEGLKLIRAG